MYKVAVLKGDSITNAPPAFLKILGTLTENICNENSFQCSYGWCRLESSNYLIETLLKAFIFFAETFKAAVFSESRSKM